MPSSQCGGGLDTVEAERGVEVPLQGSYGSRLFRFPLATELCLETTGLFLVWCPPNMCGTTDKTPLVGASCFPFFAVWNTDVAPDIAQLVENTALKGHIPIHGVASGFQSRRTIPH